MVGNQNLLVKKEVKVEEPKKIILEKKKVQPTTEVPSSPELMVMDNKVLVIIAVLVVGLLGLGLFKFKSNDTSDMEKLTKLVATNFCCNH